MSAPAAANSTSVRIAERFAMMPPSASQRSSSSSLHSGPLDARQTKYLYGQHSLVLYSGRAVECYAADGTSVEIRRARVTNFPIDHPQRTTLNDEVHARPPEPLVAPLRLSCLAIVADWSSRQTQLDQLINLAGLSGVEPPQPSTTHYSANFGSFRLNWERHTEFSRYTFIVEGVSEHDPFKAPATDGLPADFLKALPGQVIAATHAVFVEDGPAYDDAKALAACLFDSNVLVGAEVAGGRARAFTDFRIRSDGAGAATCLQQRHDPPPRPAGRFSVCLRSTRTG